MKPVILVTSSLTEDEQFIKMNRAYTSCVEKAGGIAIMPDYHNPLCGEVLMELADGILLSGGVDIDPYNYGQEPIKEIGEITPLRDSYEIAAVKAAAKLKRPILGICRGLQVINAAFGGKLFQDIYSQMDTPIKHAQTMPKHYPSHGVVIKENSKLKAITGASEIRVNSLHHQAVSVLGKGLKATATACDGVIEAIEHESLPFCLGVQWHPEHMDTLVQFEIFAEFIRMASSTKDRG